MGDIGQGLYEFFAPQAVHGIQTESQYNGEREAGNQAVKRDAQGIDQNTGKLIGLKKLDEIVKTNPFASPDSICNPVFLEGDLYTQHGIVLENQ